MLPEPDARETYAARVDEPQQDATPSDGGPDPTSQDDGRDEVTTRTANPAMAAAGDDPANPLGIPGPRFGQSPFTIGFGFALGALLAYTLFQGAAKVSGPLLTIVVAIFLAIGLDPIVSRFERGGMRRGFAIALVFGGFALLVAGFVALIVPTLVTQLNSLVDNLPGTLRQLRENESIRNLDDKYQIVDKIQAALTGRVTTSSAGSSGPRRCSPGWSSAS